MIGEYGKAPAASKALVGAAVTQAAGAVAVSTGAGAATGAATAVSGILGAAGVSASVPVAGWIVAGGLLATAGIVSLVYHFKNKGRREAMAYAETLGEGGKAFAREYADHVDKSPAKIQKRMQALEKKISRKEGRDWRVFARFRDWRIRTLVDRLNADTVILAMQQAQPEQPIVAGEPASVPVVAQASGGVPSWAAPAVLVAGGGAALYLATRPLGGLPLGDACSRMQKSYLRKESRTWTFRAAGRERAKARILAKAQAEGCPWAQGDQGGYSPMPVTGPTAPAGGADQASYIPAPYTLPSTGADTATRRNLLLVGGLSVAAVLLVVAVTRGSR